MLKETRRKSKKKNSKQADFEGDACKKFSIVTLMMDDDKWRFFIALCIVQIFGKFQYTGLI